MQKLKVLLNDLESKIEFHEAVNPKVSKSNLAWHLDHCLKVINGVTQTIKTSNPEDYKWKFNFKKSLVYLLGSIPRGKAKAPKSVQSIDEIKLSDLQLQLKNAYILINDLEFLKPNHNFKHPYFGVLNTKETIKFLNIHTHHHIKIMNDILKKSTNSL
ncbi:DUF1569 domain-containing protein [Flavobacterium sp.]|uniref:DUF1569 domain-containing protein n=1 Tax=Flavobacterium sp. TaxID=239 RepID=UPI00286DB1EF|nr:DUF1569 domain-containing protein [Flavobacterium sp.]